MRTQMESLGFDSWFANYFEQNNSNGFNAARVTAVNKNNYIVSNGISEIKGELTGKFLFDADSQIDFPTTGDWVYVQYFDDDSFAVIHDILPRKSLLKRKSSGKKIDFQLIAANIDTAFIVQSLDNNFNIRRLERYIAMITESNIEPVILLSKMDLISSDKVESKVDEIKKIMSKILIIPFSNENESGISEIKNLLTPAKTYCLLGSSGVGKTTLLNNLIEEDVLETNDVREKDSKGRHTTTRRQLLKLENGALIIDTPGMRELGNFDINDGLNSAFDEIASIAEDCKFNDCTHTNEKGCAILEALENGSITAERITNYIKMKKESEHYNRSYHQKRKHDKELGKFYKSVQNQNRKNK
ncbi:MAG: ribosome small subunit-dependent GTPase A [Ignavibacteriae bacterium]|nr:ribosome small subunit-dependent GTPase A [Ignavibacteriota bacterium]NOH00130.1 ribosome small subunit-dependent GTPase A [Ignavibacteriota bacterium]